MSHHSVFRAATALRTLPVIAVTLLIGVLVGCDTVELRTGEEAETTSNEVTIQSGATALPGARRNWGDRSPL